MGERACRLDNLYFDDISTWNEKELSGWRQYYQVYFRAAKVRGPVPITAAKIEW
jgi:hypothetical protein